MQDVDFFRQAIGALEGKANINKDAVYIAGFSMGGEFASEMAAEMPHTFAGVGSIHGTKMGFDK
jgi:poly(3-hydroxybutyrate) depolymerase